MQENEDILEALEFLNNYQFNPNWEYQFFVSQRHYKIFKFLNNQQSSVGIWLDKHEICKLETENYLLMSVFAGKSGQKLELEIKTKLLKIVAQNPKKNYILDGGFEVEKNYPNLQNLQIVSYSSFWKLWELDKK
jgi:hypothetical protein